MTTMNRSGRVLIAATAVGLLVAQAQRATAQGQKPPAPVSIVQSVPLPISGTVTVGGDTSVTVNNTATAPVPTRDVDRVVREAFQVGVIPTSFSGSSATRDLVTVPAGKRLVVEYASAWINAGGAGGLLAVSIYTGSQAVNDLPCTPQGQNALNFVYACGALTKQYVNAGETLRFSVETFANSGGFFRVLVSGYYEPAP